MVDANFEKFWMNRYEMIRRAILSDEENEIFTGGDDSTDMQSEILEDL